MVLLKTSIHFLELAFTPRIDERSEEGGGQEVFRGFREGKGSRKIGCKPFADPKRNCRLVKLQPMHSTIVFDLEAGT